MNIRPLTVVLLVLLCLLQYPLWFGRGGVGRVQELEEQLAEQESVNESLRLRNKQLEGDVRSLSEGVEAIEERARNDFGMVRQDEVFIQLVQPDEKKENLNSVQ
ncbi:MAG: cell division protein FtsB [Limnobacter sp.]|nr:cell division protein FtsB [Limnobacter sp.]